MPLRAWYAIAGGVWGVILGPLAGLLLAAGGMALAGRVMQAAPMQPGALASSVLLLCLFSGVGIGVACFFGGWEYRRDMMSTVEREAALARLLADRHDITDAVLASGQDGKINLRLAVKGRRDGEYRLQWRVRDGEGGPLLLEAFNTRRLTAQEKLVDVGVDMMAVGRTYRKTPAGAAGTGLVVERKLDFEVVIEPLLDANERSALSAEELRRLAGDQSQLRVVRRLIQNMRFVADDE